MQKPKTTKLSSHIYKHTNRHHVIIMIPNIKYVEHLKELKKINLSNNSKRIKREISEVKKSI